MVVGVMVVVVSILVRPKIVQGRPVIMKSFVIGVVYSYGSQLEARGRTLQQANMAGDFMIFSASTGNASYGLFGFLAEARCSTVLFFSSFHLMSRTVYMQRDEYVLSPLGVIARRRSGIHLAVKKRGCLTSPEGSRACWSTDSDNSSKRQLLLSGRYSFIGESES